MNFYKLRRAVAFILRVEFAGGGSSVVLAATQLLEEDDDLICSVNRIGMVVWTGSARGLGCLLDRYWAAAW
jgi:hypothetical protein